MASAAAASLALRDAILKSAARDASTTSQRMQGCYLHTLPTSTHSLNPLPAVVGKVCHAHAEKAQTGSPSAFAPTSGAAYTSVAWAATAAEAAGDGEACLHRWGAFRGERTTRRRRRRARARTARRGGVGVLALHVRAQVPCRIDGGPGETPLRKATAATETAASSQAPQHMYMDARMLLHGCMC
eukprot:351012-Chlamydomonas_euryale.AAC.15